MNGSCNITAVVNYKGGVGKTTLAMSLAGELCNLGNRVGIIDTDSQPGNAAFYLGMKREDNLYRALVGDRQPDGSSVPVELSELVREVPDDSWYAPAVQVVRRIGDDGAYEALEPLDPQPARGVMYLLPSGDNTFNAPLYLGDINAFQDLLDEFAEEYQLSHIIIDTSPTRSYFDPMVFGCAHNFVYVTEPVEDGLAGLVEVFDQVERLSRRRVRRGQKPARVLGIVPNKVRLKEHRENLDVMRDEKSPYRDYLTTSLRQLKTYVHLSKYGQTLRAYAPRCEASIEMVKVLYQLMEKVYA